MKKLTKGIMLMSVLGFLSGCLGGPSLKNYSEMQPQISLEDYFNGPIKAWGIVQDHKGNVTRRFDVDMVGSWKDGVGTLDEKFEYYDGETQTRVWTITKVDNNKYEGRADDILDHASGEVTGNVVRWHYVMDLPVGGTTYRIKFDDWMFMMNDGVLINRSYLKKFGLTVAELTLFMQKQEK